MRVAKIDKGIVTNVLLVDAVSTGQIQTDTANIGDSYVGGVFTPPALPIPTPQELMLQAVNAVKAALQSNIDDKAKLLGFSSGNGLMLYAGFTNAFQPLAQTFAIWEASIWVAADAYKAEVVAGTKPMLSPDEAVAMMPVYHG